MLDFKIYTYSDDLKLDNEIRKGNLLNLWQESHSGGSKYKINY